MFGLGILSPEHVVVIAAHRYDGTFEHAADARKALARYRLWRGTTPIRSGGMLRVRRLKHAIVGLGAGEQPDGSVILHMSESDPPVTGPVYVTLTPAELVFVVGSIPSAVLDATGRRALRTLQARLRSLA